MFENYEFLGNKRRRGSHNAQKKYPTLRKHLFTIRKDFLRYEMVVSSHFMSTSLSLGTSTTGRTTNSTACYGVRETNSEVFDKPEKTRS